MGLSPKSLGKYTLKTYNSPLYTWNPSSSDKKAKNNQNQSTAGAGGNKYYCTATPYSQGEDWISTYSYNIAVSSSGVQERIAYVECDYVQ